MAGKLKIKRNGGCLPTLSLLVLLLLGGVLAWLSLVGLPGSVLRDIEQEAAAAGVPVKIGAVKLAPGSGLALKVENVSLTVPQPGAPDAALTVRKLRVGFSLARLLSGNCIPSTLYLRDTDMTVPLSAEDGDTLQALDMDAQGTYNAGEGKLDFKFQTLIQGVELELRAHLPEKLLTGGGETAEQEKPFDLEQSLAEIRPQLQEVHRQIALQHWKNPPFIRLAVDLMDPDSPRAMVQANAESYEAGEYHLRNLALDANYHDNVVVVNAARFHTVDPDTEVEFQGGYDITRKQLDFRMESDAPLLTMLRTFLDKDAPEALRAFQHAQNTTPHIELEGQVDFSDDYAINHISTRGSFEMGKCSFNDSPVDRVFLTFFLSNGNLNINELSIEFPDGALRASANLADGQEGHAEADVNLPAPSLLKLLGNLYGEPVTPPNGIKAHGNIHLALETDLSAAPFDPGTTRLQDLLPALHRIEALLEPERLECGAFSLTRPSLRVSVDGTSLALNQEVVEAERVTAGFTADAVEAQVADTTYSTVKPALHADFQGVHLLPNDIESSTAQHIDANVSAESFTSPHGTMRGIALHADAPDVSKDWGKSIADSRALLRINEFQNEYGAVSGVELKADIESDRNGSASLAMDVDGRHFSTGLKVSQLPNDSLLLTVQNANVPLAALAPLIFPDGTPAAEDIKMPGQVLLSAHARLDLGTRTLGVGGFHLHIPELVRISHTVPALRGKETRLAVTLDAEWSLNEVRDILYTASACITAPTGEMTVDLEGDLERRVRITGKSDIRPDTFDALIDDIDAHRILCDFRYREGSRVVADNIDATIDYSNGTRVTSHCDATLHDLDYMTGCIVAEKEEDGTPTGKESVRTDLPDKDPLTSIKKATCAVDVDLLLDAADAAGQPIPNRQIVNLSGITLEYDNRPWQQRRGFKGGPATSTFTCSNIRFDLETNEMVLENGSGLVYPAYAFGTFFPPLENFMKDIIAPLPVQVDSQRCTFPLAKRSEAPILGTIRITTDKPAAYHFLGTDLPLDRFSAFVDLTDDFVTVDRINGKCCGGALDAAVKIGITGESSSVDGFANLDCADLQKLAAAYGKEQKPANCRGQIRFRSPSTDLRDLQAYGEAKIENGDLMQLGIFSPISDFISDIPGHFFKLKESATGKEATPGLFRRCINAVFSSPKKVVKGIGDTAGQLPFMNHFFAYDIQDAYLSFTIKGGHMKSRTMKAMGANLTVNANLDLDLDTMAVQGDMWPKLSSVPSVMIAPLTFLSKFVVDIKLYGTLQDLKWKFGLNDKLTHANEEPQTQPKP